MSENTFDEQFKNETVAHVALEVEKNETEKVTKKKKEEVAFTLSDKPSRILPSLIEELDRKSTRLNSSHSQQSRMPSSA